MEGYGFTSAKHFVLIHGACHGAWCWYKLLTMLKEAGHKVTAIDLAASGRNEERLEDLHTIDDYHKPLYSFMEALSPDDNDDDDKVILVGHSMGGYAVSSAMERFPEKIACGVFVSAYMLGPDLNIDQLTKRFSPGPEFYMDSEEYTIGEFGDTQTIILLGNKFMATKLYQNSPPEDLNLAILSLRRTKFFNDKESKKQLLTSKEKYGRVRRAYIIGGSDEALLTDVQRWMVEINPPNMAREIEGADHMVMFSKPQELCSILLEIAQE